MKEIRIKCQQALTDAAEVAADRLGLTVTAYTRMALIERMARDGIHPEQPAAD